MKIDPTRHASFELLLVRLPNTVSGLTVAVTYRPPQSSVPNFIADLKDLLDSGELGNRYIICGDLNCPGPANTRGLINGELETVIDEYNLSQHVHSPTCRTGNILDHILTPVDMTTVSAVLVNDIGLSDHSLVTCKIAETFHKTPTVTATFRSWKRLNLDMFRSKYSQPRCTRTQQRLPMRLQIKWKPT